MVRLEGGDLAAHTGCCVCLGWSESLVRTGRREALLTAFWRTMVFPGLWLAPKAEGAAQGDAGGRLEGRERSRACGRVAGTRGRRVGIFQEEGQLRRVFLPRCRGGLRGVGLSTAGPRSAPTGHTAGLAVPAEAVVSRDAPFTLLGCRYLAITFFKYAITWLFK